MKKTLLALTLLSFTQIPDPVTDKAKEYLSYAGGGCGNIPEVTLIGKKFEDRQIKLRLKDGIKDSVFLYQINNSCDWPNVPSHFTYTFFQKKDGTFEEIGSFDESGIYSRDSKGKPIIPEEW